MHEEFKSLYDITWDVVETVEGVYYIDSKLFQEEHSFLKIMLYANDNYKRSLEYKIEEGIIFIRSVGKQHEVC